MNRKYIRKLVLQEFRNRLVEQEEKKQKSFPNREVAQQAKEELEKNAALLGEGVPPEGPAGNGTMLSKADAQKLADDFYEAFSGTELASGQLFGMGTNETLIIDTLGKIPTLADLSFVANEYDEMHSGIFGIDSLSDALSGEYSSFFNKDEFYKVRSAIEAVYNRGLFAINGEVYTVRQMRQVEKRARAAQQDFLKNVDKGNVDTYADRALETAQVGATAAGVTTGALAGVGAVSALAGVTGYSLAAAPLAGAIATGGAVSAVGGMGGAVGATLGLSNPAGWAVLAAAAIGVGLIVALDGGDFNEKELKMLSPDFYRGLGAMFKELSKNFQAAADAINLDEYPAEGEEGSAGPGEEGKEYPALGWGLERSFIENIVKTMNAYDETRGGIEGYVKSTPAKAWNPQIQESWRKFAPHALLNCSIYEFHKDKAEDADSWLTLSAAMKSDFPGYTPNPRGCLAFCLDAYYDDVRFGKGGASSGGGGTPAPSPGDVDPVPDSKPQKGGGKIRIESTGGSDRVSISVPFNNATESALIRSIEDQFSENARRTAIKAASLEFDIILKKDGSIRRVKRRKPMGGAERDNFKGNLQRTVEDALEGRMQIFNKKKNDEKKKYLTPEGNLRIVIVIPGGYRIR